MKEKSKNLKKLNVRKLKLLKEFYIRYELQAGGCSVAAGCSHIM